MQSITAPVIVPQMFRDRIVGARLSVAGKTSASNAVVTVQVRAFPFTPQGGAGTAYQVFSIPFANTGTNLKASPIVPINGDGPRNRLDLSINARISVTYGVTATIDGLTLDILVLDGPISRRSKTG